MNNIRFKIVTRIRIWILVFGSSIQIRNRVTFWNQILFVFVYGWFSQTKYYLYSYSGEFLRLNTTGKFFWVLLIFCWALILLMNGPQSLINGHIKICHSTFTFLMTGSTNPLKKCVREWFSLSTWHCQNYFVRQNCNLSSYTRVTSGGSYGLEAVCICS